MAGVLYKKEREVLEFLAQFQKQYGYSPTLGEIAKATGHRSNATVHALIRSLVDKGYVQKVEGNARVLKIIDQKIAAIMTGTQTAIELPLMGYIASGKSLEPYKDPNATFQISANLISGKYTAYILQVKGDSLKHEGMLDGDLLLVEKTVDPKEDDIVIVAIDGAVILRKYAKEGTKVMLKSLSKDETISSSNLTIQGKITSVIRKFI